MRIVRTFHPVGQGAFYTEHFYIYRDAQQREIHHILYDCGCKSAYSRKNVVLQEFNKDDNIEYLFISHLDEDHISLVETLITQVGSVKNIVLPLVSKEELYFIWSYHRALKHKDAADFIERIIRYIGYSDDNLEENSPKVIFVGDPDREKEYHGKADFWKNGERREASWDPDWVFIPYNMNFHIRLESFLFQLEDVVRKPEFGMVINNIGEAPIGSVAELYNRLLDAKFVEKMLTTPRLKLMLRDAYKRIEGGTNGNSLILYSGPDSHIESYAMKSCIPSVTMCCCDNREAGCLYTGDNHFELQDWKEKFSDVWNHIDTIQLPHHGSSRSFDVDKCNLDKCYILPVSLGLRNSYGHPSGRVLAFLLSQGCSVPTVTEMANSRYMQEIRRW